MFLFLKFAVCTNLVFGLVDTHPIFCLASFIVLIDTSKFSHFSCKSSRICLPVSSSFAAIVLSMNFIWSELSFGVWEPRGKSVVTPCCYNFLRILQRYSWHFKSSWGKNISEVSRIPAYTSDRRCTRTRSRIFAHAHVSHEMRLQCARTQLEIHTRAAVNLRLISVWMMIHIQKFIVTDWN